MVHNLRTNLSLVMLQKCRHVFLFATIKCSIHFNGRTHADNVRQQRVLNSDLGPKWCGKSCSAGEDKGLWIYQNSWSCSLAGME